MTTSITDSSKVLSVYKYFEDATVISKLKSAVKNVGAELTSANIAHLTANKVTNMDLQPLWQKFMEKKLKEIEDFSTNWVKTMITYAENAYKTELTTLQAQEKTLVAAQKNQAQLTKNNQQRTTINADAQKLKVKWHNADKKREDAEDAVVKMAANANATIKQKENAGAELEKAEKVTLEALKAYNLKLREGNKLDLLEVRKMIANAKKDQDILAKFKAYNSKFKMPSAK